MSDTNITLVSDVSSVIFASLFSLLAVVGTIGNVLVILAISLDRKSRRSSVDYLLVNLACADLGNLLFCTPEWVQPAVFQSSAWVLPPELCPVFRFIEVMFLYASVQTQLLISIERFVAIVYPLKANSFMDNRRIGGFVVLIWCFGLCFSLPYAVYHKVAHGECHFTWAFKNPILFRLFKYLECACFYFIPLLVILCLYGRVIRVLWKKEEIDLHQNDRRENLRIRRNVVKMLITCVAVYFVCYSPIQALIISGYRVNLNYEFRLTLNALTFASSAANPIIYTIFSRKFRAKFVELLKCRRPISEVTATISKFKRGSSCAEVEMLMANKNVMHLQPKSAPCSRLSENSSSVGHHSETYRTFSQQELFSTNAPKRPPIWRLLSKGEFGNILRFDNRRPSVL